MPTWNPLFTAFLYFLLVKAVQNKEEVPSWMYKIGHALKARVKNSYENTTNRQALQEVNITLLLFIVLNGIVFSYNTVRELAFLRLFTFV